MSDRIATERQELAGMVEAALGELGSFVTGDVAKARPPAWHGGRVHRAP